MSVVGRYWAQRSDLFRLYDEGNIYMTDDAWFGVTAEPIAEYAAVRLLFSHRLILFLTHPSHLTLISHFSLPRELQMKPTTPSPHPTNPKQAP